LDEQVWTVAAARLGEVQLRRENVVAVQNMVNAGQWAAGRFDLSQWQAARGQQRFWQVNSQGQLLSTRQNVHLYREADLPASCLIEVEIGWTKKLDFLLALGVPENARQADQLPRLETWDDALVFSYGDNFEIVMESFLNKQQRVRLLLHWDQTTQSVAVHDATGKLLCSADLSELKVRRKPGIYIENKAGDLIVSQLLIRQSQAGFDSTRPSYQIVNQGATNGRIVSFDGQTWTIALDQDQPEGGSEDQSAKKVITVPHSEFSSAFSLIPPPTSDWETNARTATQVDYFDGMYLSGQLEGGDALSLRMACPAGTKPWTVQLAGARQIKFPVDTPPAADQSFAHQMVHSVGTMRGRLEPGSQQAGDIVQWRLPGASRSVPFASAEAKIVLQKRQSRRTATESWPDTMYFYNRDRIPCRIQQIVDGIVHFESFAESQQLDAALIKAIDFQASNLSVDVTPTDPAWLIPEKSRPLIEQQAEAMQVVADSTWGHASLMRTGGFEFDFQWRPGMYGAMELELFGDLRLEQPGRMKIMLFFYDNNVMARSQENEINNSYVAKNHQVRLQVRLEGATLKVLAGNQVLLAQPFTADAQRGAGVQWRLNRVNESEFRGQLTQVRRWVASEQGDTNLVATEQRDLLLTIPRLKKANPPQHILRATNGDLLRGELMRLDQESLQFQANQETLRFPREVVSAVIWLHFKPDAFPDKSVQSSDGTTPEELPVGLANAPHPAGEAIDAVTMPVDPLRQTVQILVSGDRRLTFDLQAWRENQLIGQSAALGRCAIDLAQIEELRFGSFANQALDVPYSDWVARLAPEPVIQSGSDGEPGSERLFGSQSPLIGSEAPDLSLPLLDGETLSLQSLRGKVVVLDFWATWCSPCIRALPDLMAATGEFSADDVILVAVNQEEDVATIKTFLSNRGWALTVGLDNGALARRLQVQSLPQTVVIGPDGKIAFIKTGYTRDLRESLQRAITSLLGD
jgi:thiol-disulfide isomerase/thioredoxin